jgi:PPOX class probable F420-dependent enzyme
MPDFSSDFGKRAEERLRKEIVGWLTTVGGDGTPQPSLVWFHWDGESIMIYSQPDTPKVRNITRYPRIAFNLDSDGRGGNMVILTGQAIIDRNAPPVNENPAYLAKYGDHITRIGRTPESFAAAYSVPIRFTPTKLRGI